MRLLFIVITNDCNRACFYCPIAMWRNVPPQKPSRTPCINNEIYSITLEQIVKFIDRIKPTHVEITGGEPTLVEWLDDLCGYLEANNIVYLVKSNGLKRCRNQITAWHDQLDKPPKNYDKILIIQKNDYMYHPFNTDNWQRKLMMGTWKEKENYCKRNNIPYGLIGFNNSPIMDMDLLGNYEFYPETFSEEVQTMFLCPNGEVKRCHEFGMSHDYIATINDTSFKWERVCSQCKSVLDFVKFLDVETRR